SRVKRITITELCGNIAVDHFWLLRWVNKKKGFITPFHLLSSGGLRNGGSLMQAARANTMKLPIILLGYLIYTPLNKPIHLRR
ncbi:TPA: hypothetical protein ACSP8J_003748, partial [Aeromonas veronii]